MDFFSVKTKQTRYDTIVYPEFKVLKSKDLMIRGKTFYGIWDESTGLWNKDDYAVQRIVDSELYKYLDGVPDASRITLNTMSNFSSKSWSEFKTYTSQLSDNWKQLDEYITMADEETTKSQYRSKKLSYTFSDAFPENYDKLVSTLYDEEERAKIEWSIGAILSGDARTIQKFLVLYGEGGMGKSTMINIVQSLFESYCSTFDAKALANTNNAFSTEVFKNSPLVAIQHDGDLSKIEDNTKLNSITAHEDMTMNEKHKPMYTAKVNCFLIMGTNKPVKITDAKSGIIRRLIDVYPSGRLLPNDEYEEVIKNIDYELGAIANHCLKVYKKMGKHYYAHYKPIRMIFETDVFFNFVESYYFDFEEKDGVSLAQAYEMYKSYVTDAGLEFKIPRHKFREELKVYFDSFSDITRIDNKQVRSWYAGFKKGKFEKTVLNSKEPDNKWVVLEKNSTSILDEVLSDCPAQLANEDGTPTYKWDNVKTNLRQINSSKLHYVKPPVNHIVIDIDVGDEKGKNLLMAIDVANTFPKTYVETSKSGNGLHLHYIYDGDIEALSNIYAPNVEIKKFNGKSSLRRKLTLCQNNNIAHLSSGLPIKEKKMINDNIIQTEKHLLTLIKKNLNKEIHPDTTSSVSMIHKLLDDAYSSGMIYDVTEIRNDVLSFAASSTNQSKKCIDLVTTMHFKSDDVIDYIPSDESEKDIVFFDIEIFKNLFVVCAKRQGSPILLKYVNPTPEEVSWMFEMRLIGFNNRSYDNHMLYAHKLGYTVFELYNLSKKIIGNSKNCKFREAYNLSYADIYDFGGKEMGLKKYELLLGIKHNELGLDWDEEAPEELWDKIVEYCCDDVVATEKVFDHLEVKYNVRCLLAKLSGMTVNDTTATHAAKILFGYNKNPQDEFVYTRLDETFPGYKYEFGKSQYRGEDPKEGGYVWGKPGVYYDVALLDIASMHPTSLIQMNYFGPYTARYEEIVKARLAVKHRNYDVLQTALDGILLPYLSEDNILMSQLAEALKTVINSVYGYTSAPYDNIFKHKDNVDNIVAKRGALFMIDLRHAVEEAGINAIHIKTDSIKIANATQSDINFVMEFGKKYGYTFEHEATYTKLCLINDAEYICKDAEDGHWSSKGATFKEPYTFKQMFSKEPITISDLKQIKAVKTSLYLVGETEEDKIFVGKAGAFVPVKTGRDLMREKDGKYHSASGAKGYKWAEIDSVDEENIDYSYYNKMVDDAMKKINEFCDAEAFVA